MQIQRVDTFIEDPSYPRLSIHGNTTGAGLPGCKTTEMSLQGLGPYLGQWMCLVIAVLVLSYSAGAASLPAQKHRLRPSGVRGLRQLPVTDKGTTLHACLLQLATGVEQNGDARILNLREEYELESMTQSIGPDFSEQLAAQMPEARVREFCEATRALYPSNGAGRFGAADSGKGHSPDSTPSGKTGPAGRVSNDHTPAASDAAAPTSPNNRTLPAAAAHRRARGAVGQQQKSGVMRASSPPQICTSSTLDCPLYCFNRLCTEFNATYADAVQQTSPSVDEMLSTIGEVYKDRSFNEDNVTERTNNDKVAAAEITCQAFDFTNWYANVLCGIAGSFGTWEGVGGGSYQAIGEMVCLGILAVLEAGLKSCLLVTRYAGVLDTQVDHAEIHAVYVNTRRAIFNQQEMYKQVAQAQSELGTYKKKLATTLCDIKNLIGATQREANHLRFLAYQRQADGVSSCTATTPKQCTSTSQVNVNLAACTGGFGQSTNVPTQGDGTNVGTGVNVGTGTNVGTGVNVQPVAPTFGK